VETKLSDTKNSKSVVYGIAGVLFLVGIGAMIIAESALSIVFMFGLGIFIVSIVIFIIGLFWKIAKSADNFFSDI